MSEEKKVNPADIAESDLEQVVGGATATAQPKLPSKFGPKGPLHMEVENEDE